MTLKDPNSANLRKKDMGAISVAQVVGTSIKICCQRVGLT